MTSNDFEKWGIKYDISGVIENKFETQNIKWDKCFSSDLPRAIKTSETIFKGELIVCHGFFMKVIEKELKRRGFRGQNIPNRPIAKNGTLHLYKK